DEFEMRLDLNRAHPGGLDGAGVILAEAPEIFPGDRADFRRRFFREGLRQIVERHVAVAPGQMKGESAARPAEPGDEAERQRLDHGHHAPRQPVDEGVHWNHEWTRSNTN